MTDCGAGLFGAEALLNSINARVNSPVFNSYPSHLPFWNTEHSWLPVLCKLLSRR